MKINKGFIIEVFRINYRRINVSKNLNFLVIGEKPTRKKLDQAKTLGVEIISQNDLKKLLN